MAWYSWTTGTPLGFKLRRGLDNLRAGRQDLLDVLATLNQMTTAQVTAAVGFSDGINPASDTVAGNAKTELTSDIGKLAIGDSAGAAIQQMLDQFAG